MAEAGAGPPLIMLHGWPRRWWSWRHLISAFARESYHVRPAGDPPVGWSDHQRRLCRGRPGGRCPGVARRGGFRRGSRIIGHDWRGFISLSSPSSTRRASSVSWRSTSTGVAWAARRAPSVSGSIRRGVKALGWPGGALSGLGAGGALGGARSAPLRVGSTRATRIVRLVVVALSLILRLLRRPVCGFVRPGRPDRAGCSRERSQPLLLSKRRTCVAG